MLLSCLIFTQLDYVFVAKCKFLVCQHATAKSSHSTSLQSGRLSCLGNAFLSCLNLPCPVWPETHYGPPSASDEQNPDSHLLAPSVSPLGQGKSLGRPSCLFNVDSDLLYQRYGMFALCILKPVAADTINYKYCLFKVF